MQSKWIHTLRLWHSGENGLTASSAGEGKVPSLTICQRGSSMRMSSTKTYHSLLNKVSVQKPQNTPSKNVTSHRSLFDWEVVTHRDVMPELFRCPSPRWAPFHRLSTAGNRCHRLGTPYSVPAIRVDWLYTAVSPEHNNGGGEGNGKEM